ncbi:DNA-binding LytR/AlgR family response regulator [Methylopila capsulata]|uniref:Response regulator n=1 Tax=Methylopila capsulata TaxID=61654 RepID=A0A9W6IXZ7_9HYPH|nr:response regulator [Methylopila capsulata]MBM7853477.1 DNA-binding LytR/AlgR family response regulator [Methylopila capsulata]GLK57309.1 response regulator [Methylopila capsulata]
MRVLIVEDDMVIAGNLGPIITRAGHDLVGLAAEMGSAVALLRSTRVDVAFIDIHLLDGRTGVEVARVAAEEGAVAIFTTANRGLAPPDFAGACGVIEKPYHDAAIEAALAYVAARLADGWTAAPPPPGFELSPQWAKRPNATPRPRPAATESQPSV